MLAYSCTRRRLGVYGDHTARAVMRTAMRWRVRWRRACVRHRACVTADSPPAVLGRAAVLRLRRSCMCRMHDALANTQWDPTCTFAIHLYRVLVQCTSRVFEYW